MAFGRNNAKKMLVQLIPTPIAGELERSMKMVGILVPRTCLRLRGTHPWHQAAEAQARSAGQTAGFVGVRHAVPLPIKIR